MQHPEEEDDMGVTLPLQGYHKTKATSWPLVSTEDYLQDRLSHRARRRVIRSSTSD